LVVTPPCTSQTHNQQPTVSKGLHCVPLTPPLTMARTKQTATKSTGGKPTKRVHPGGAAAAAVISRYNDLTVRIGNADNDREAALEKMKAAQAERKEQEEALDGIRKGLRDAENAYAKMNTPPNLDSGSRQLQRASRMKTLQIFSGPAR